MDDFYENIKKSVEELSEDKSSTAAWSSFQSYRAAKTAPPPKAFPWLLAATIALILLLLGSNVYWANKSVSSISEQNTTIIHDTIYITETTEKPNQQLENIILALQSQLEGTQKALAVYDHRYQVLQTQFAAADHYLSGPPSTLYTERSQLSLLSPPSFLSISPQSKEETITAVTENELGDRPRLLTCPSIPTLWFGELVLHQPPPVQLEDVIWSETKKRFNLLASITPKSFSLNANAGIRAHLTGNSKSSLGPYLDLNASTLIGEKIRGRLGLYVFRGQNEINGEADYPGTPTISVPNDEEIKEIKINTTSLGLQFGLDYLIHTVSNWSPYLGFGYAHSISNKDKFAFEINSPQGEYYISPEYAISQTNISQLLLSFGADYQLNATLDATAGIAYYLGLSPEKTASLNLTGGLYYRF